MVCSLGEPFHTKQPDYFRDRSFNRRGLGFSLSLWHRDDVLAKGQAEISFEDCGVLYRLSKHPYVNGGKPLKQVMVPEKLRPPILEGAYG